MILGAMLHANRWKLYTFSIDQQIVPITPRRYADESYSASEKLARHVHNFTLFVSLNVRIQSSRELGYSKAMVLELAHGTSLLGKTMPHGLVNV